MKVVEIDNSVIAEELNPLKYKNKREQQYSLAHSLNSSMYIWHGLTCDKDSRN